MKLAIIASLSLIAAAGAAHADDTLRFYSVQGTNPNGSPYGGAAVIEATSPDTCNIVWKTGSTESKGFCMRSGNILSAAYILGEVVGLVIYEIKPDGSLQGTWTIADKPGVGTEILTPQQ
ncbi:MAG: hypothetical protein FJX66_00375 [Alphaproteobacteria bacterium]|nr:hypothetical protein [Alphaproteobacteria bacterium]